MGKISYMQVMLNVRPSLELRHANAKGTGSALRARLILGEDQESRGILLGLAPQLTVGSRLGANPVAATFDVKNAKCAFLGFVEVAQLLQVLRGETESISEGKGIWQMYEDGVVIVKFEHRVDPCFGYDLQVLSRQEGREEESVHLFLSPAESLGLCEAFAVAMKQIAFGK